MRSVPRKQRQGPDPGGGYIGRRRSNLDACEAALHRILDCLEAAERHAAWAEASRSDSMQDESFRRKDRKMTHDPNDEAIVGSRIEELQRKMSEPVHPAPDWLPDWQIRAEHVVAMAHFAKDRMDIDQLRKLDVGAEELLEEFARKRSAH